MKVVPVDQAEMDAWKVDFRSAVKLWEMFRELEVRGFNVEFTGGQDSSLVITSFEDDEFMLRAHHRQWIVIGQKDDIRVYDEVAYRTAFRQL